MTEITGAVPDHEPLVRFHTFGDSRIGFTVILGVGEFSDQYRIKHEFIKRLHKRYRDGGHQHPGARPDGRPAAGRGGHSAAADRPRGTRSGVRPGAGRSVVRPARQMRLTSRRAGSESRRVVVMAGPALPRRGQ